MAIGIALGLAVACGPTVPIAEGGGESAGTSTGGETHGSASTLPGTTEATTVATSSTTTATTATASSSATTVTTVDDTAETAGFLDTATSSCFTHCTNECDVWAQDCPEGEKCMPWANDGGDSWNALRCTPIEPVPDQPGDVCTVEGSGVSGIDSCDLGAMCWNVDPETNTGYCIAMCTGSEAQPSCAGACETCVINNDGVLDLCLSQCHPAHHQCHPGEACTVIGDTFACVPWSGVGAALEGCEDNTDCADGLACLAAAQIPGCLDANCCTPLCDTVADDCAAQVPGTACNPSGIEVPGCIAGVGVCTAPA
ncbi:MAG: hypothetical protein K1X88_30220 [Nannocystaceae bacterium]|nr:hypothetical protein [Nannocystaceae bacterium]